MKVKICGIRTLEEAIDVGRLQPSAIGILVGFDKALAPNVVSEEQARRIVEVVHTLPYVIDTYMLTDEMDPEINIKYATSVGSSHIQLLGDVTLEGVTRIKEELPELNIVKVVHITGPESIDLARQYEATGVLESLLLDSRMGNVRGGTGRVHDWIISREIVRESRLPVWLAGGLRVTNLRDAMNQVQPDGVDVETGIQNPDGSKNYELIREFMEIAKSQLGSKERMQ